MANEGFAKPWLEFEEELGKRVILQPPLPNLLQEYTRVVELLAAKYGFPAPDPSVETEDTETEKGLKLRIYTPKSYKGGRPVCMYYHGGGWAMGDINGEDLLSRAVSKAGDVVVVSVEYGLAPQNAHTELMNECFEALQWALRNSQRLNTAEGKFLTAGTSAGGQLALGTALRAIDGGLAEQLVGVVAIMPATVHPDGVPEELKAKYTAMEEHDLHTINTAGAMRAFWDAFGPPPTDPYCSPLLHSRIKGLKKVYLAVASHDTLRDDGLLMKEKLDKAGVPNRLDMYECYPHTFMVWPSSKLDEPRKKFFDQMVDGINFVLA